MTRHTTLRHLAAVLGFGCLASASSQAAIIADFTDGVGSANPGQFPGTTGDGWATVWSTSGRDTTTTAVISTTPLNSGGNYLHFVDNTTTGGAYARRGYETGSGVDITQNHTISLDYRFDGDLASFTEFNDRVGIFGDTSAATGTTTTNTWLIGVGAASGGASLTVFPGNWYFFDNNTGTGFNTSNMVNTGMALVVGTVYSITVNVNPVAGTYGASITDGTTLFSADDLTFRRGAGSITGSATHYLHVAANASVATDDSRFSVDSISIVPEPGTALLAAFGSLALLRRRR